MNDIEIISMKICSVCKNNKPVCEFHKNSYKCKICTKIYCEQNKERIRARGKIWRDSHKQHISDKERRYRKLNIERLLLKEKAYRQNNQKTIKITNKNYYQRNKEKCNASVIKGRKNNYEKYLQYQRKYKKIKRKTDINYKISSNLRSRILDALKNNYKSDNTIKLLGCSVEDLKKHLESKFQPGMSWDNYGYYGWHIDHDIPCDAFDLANPEEQKVCFNYKNMKPLWARENLTKKARTDYINYQI